jgi:hypothetical protein
MHTHTHTATTRKKTKIHESKVHTNEARSAGPARAVSCSCVSERRQRKVARARDAILHTQVQHTPSLKNERGDEEVDRRFTLNSLTHSHVPPISTHTTQSHHTDAGSRRAALIHRAKMILKQVPKGPPKSRPHPPPIHPNRIKRFGRALCFCQPFWHSMDSVCYLSTAPSLTTRTHTHARGRSSKRTCSMRRVGPKGWQRHPTPIDKRQGDVCVCVCDRLVVQNLPGF